VQLLRSTHQSRFCGILGSGDRNNIDPVKVIFVPLRHEGRIAAVCGEERTSYGFDMPVLPGDEDNRVAIERLLDGGSHPIGIGEAEARIDGSPKRIAVGSMVASGRTNRRRLHHLAFAGMGRERRWRSACRRFWL
jgi:hypothetical protein